MPLNLKSVCVCVRMQGEEGEEEAERRRKRSRRAPAAVGPSPPAAAGAPAASPSITHQLRTHQVLYGRLLQKLLRRLQLIPVCGDGRGGGC